MYGHLVSIKHEVLFRCELPIRLPLDTCRKWMRKGGCAVGVRDNPHPHTQPSAHTITVDVPTSTWQGGQGRGRAMVTEKLPPTSPRSLPADHTANQELTMSSL